MATLTVEHVEKHDTDVVVIDIPARKEPLFWIPFQQGQITEAFWVNDSELIAVHKDAVASMFSIEEGREVANVEFDGVNAHYAYLNASKTLIFVLSTSSIAVIDVLTMQVVLQSDCLDVSDLQPAFKLKSEMRGLRYDPLSIQPPVYERPDGKVAIGWGGYSGLTGLGFLLLNPEDWSLEHIILKGSGNIHNDCLPSWFSPSGRYVFIQEAGDYQNKKRSGQSAVLWDVADNPKEVGIFHACGDNSIIDVLWEPDERAVWILSGKHLIQRAPLNGAPEPPRYFSRWASDGDPLKPSTYMQGWSFTKGQLSYTKDGKIRLFDKAAGSVEFAPVLPDAGPSLFSRVRAQFSGSKTPEALPILQDEDSFIEWSQKPRKKTSAFVNARVSVLTKLRDLDDLSIRKAFTDLTEKLSGDLSALTWNNTLNLMFSHGQKKLTEERFINTIIDRNAVDLGPDIATMINGYLDGVERSGHEPPWSDVNDGVPALHFVLDGLIKLDPSQLATFKRYASLQDGEHDLATLDITFKTFIGHNGWAFPDRVAFGVFVALYRLSWGTIPHNGVWDEFGLLSWVKKNLTPNEFSNLISEEARALKSIRSWDHFGPEYVAKSLLNSDPKHRSYTEDIVAALTWKRSD